MDINLVMTGEAARLMKCDQRTFRRLAKKHLKPATVLDGDKKIYRVEDVLKMKSLYNRKHGRLYLKIENKNGSTDDL